MQEARLYQKREQSRVDCLLCSHFCAIPNHRRGLCGVRENRDGRLYSLVYGKIVAEHADPVEKKPLFHLLPASRSYSIATVGCNFRCQHCQNDSISQPGSFSSDAVPGHSRSPGDIVSSALAGGCKSISYTYVEPTIFLEFACDCMAMASAAGLKNIFVSNGYMSGQAIELLQANLDAINVDLKSLRDVFYREVCGARLAPVLDNIKSLYEAGIWIEVTTLLIPGLNDSEEELRQIADFIGSIDVGIPWHVTGFHPSYQLRNLQATTPQSLEKAREIGISSGLQYVYSGNIPGWGGEDTLCPSCAKTLISRHGSKVLKNGLVHGQCPSCNTPIAGIWA